MTALTLCLAALLEVGGDALMRHGLKGGHLWGMVLGALVLVAYGVFVNLTDLNFSRLMGIYVCLFFAVSQGVAMTVFKERLTGLEMLAGGLILSGGLILTVAKMA